MMHLRHLFSANALWGVLIAALAMRALVPVGYMAAEGAEGGLTVQLCTSVGMQQITLPPDAPAPPPAEGHAEGACLFALASGPGLLPATMAPALGVADHAVLLLATRAPVHVPAIHRAQSPRAPPAFPLPG